MADTVLGPVPRGDTIQIKLPITRPNAGGVQEPVDLTDATLKATFKTAKTDPDPGVAQKTSDPDGGIVIQAPEADGIVIVTLEPGDTVNVSAPSTLYWDVQLIEVDGVTTTVDWGTLVLLEDITRATS